LVHPFFISSQNIVCPITLSANLVASCKIVEQFSIFCCQFTVKMRFKKKKLLV